MVGERTLYLLGLAVTALGRGDQARELVDRAGRLGPRARVWEANEVAELLIQLGIPCLAFMIVPGYPSDELQAAADSGLTVLCQLRAAEEGGPDRWAVLEIWDGRSRRVVALDEDSFYPHHERVGADDFTGQYVTLLLVQPKIAANLLHAAEEGGAEK